MSKKRTRNLIMQILECYIVFNFVFFLVLFLNKGAEFIITGLNVRETLSIQLVMITPIIVFVLTKFWYIKFPERHSFFTVISSWVLSEIFVYYFGGVSLFTISFLGKSIMITIASLMMLMIYFTISFVLTTFLASALHSLFVDRLQK